MGGREKEFRQKIARLTRIQKIKNELENQTKEDAIQEPKTNHLMEVSPAICGVKKTIENFRTKEIEEVRD